MLNIILAKRFVFVFVTNAKTLRLHAEGFNQHKISAAVEGGGGGKVEQGRNVDSLE